MQDAVDVELLLGGRPLHAVDVVAGAQTEIRGSVAGAPVGGGVAIPVDVPDHEAVDAGAAAVDLAVLADVDLGAGAVWRADGVSHGGRLHPEGGPHARRAVVVDAGLDVAVGVRIGVLGGDHPGVVGASAGVGGDGELAIGDGDGAGGVHRIAAGAGEPVPPLGGVHGGAFELVVPREVPAGPGRRRGGQRREGAQRDGEQRGEDGEIVAKHPDGSLDADPGRIQ